MTDNKEFAKQMRENAIKNEQGNIVCSPELWEEIASLIDRAIAPPCKVGDKLYRIIGDDFATWEIVRIEIYEDESGFIDDSDNWYSFEDIGKTVFLTKEEAEKALKERERK